MQVAKIEAIRSPQGRTVIVTFDDGSATSWTFGPIQKPDKSWALPPVADVAREVKALVEARIAGSGRVADTALQVELDKP